MAHFITKQLLFAFFVLASFSAQADFSNQLTRANSSNKKIEIVEFDLLRDSEAIKNIMKEGWEGFSGYPYNEKDAQKLLLDDTPYDPIWKKINASLCEEQQARILSNMPTRIKVLRLGNQTIGFLKYAKQNAFYSRVGVESLEIELLGIDPKFRNQGLGYTLLSAAQNIAEKNKAEMMYLYAFINNQSAINLYKKFGFSIFPERHNLIKMCKPLTQQKQF